MRWKISRQEKNAATKDCMHINDYAKHTSPINEFMKHASQTFMFPSYIDQSDLSMAQLKFAPKTIFSHTSALITNAVVTYEHVAPTYVTLLSMLLNKSFRRKEAIFRKWFMSLFFDIIWASNRIFQFFR